jgi:hypothetical protein
MEQRFRKVFHPGAHLPDRRDLGLRMDAFLPYPETLLLLAGVLAQGGSFARSSYGDSLMNPKEMTILTQAQSMIDDLEDLTERMTDWEREFVESIVDQLENGVYITDLQFTKLEEIHDQY